MTLTYRLQGRSGIIWDVLSGSLVIARIRKQVSSIDARRLRIEQWDWTFYVSAKPDGFLIYGSAESLEETKALVDQHWRAWLEAAGLTES